MKEKLQNEIDRRGFLRAIAGSTAAAATGVWSQTVHAGGERHSFEVAPCMRQLFLDDVGIGRLDGVRRSVHESMRHPRNPLLVPDTPWERGCQVYGTALFDEEAERFRPWYLTGPKDRGLKPLRLDGYERAPHTTMAAYAESRDGVDRVKPKLGICPYDGDTVSLKFAMRRCRLYSWWFASETS